MNDRGGAEFEAGDMDRDSVSDDLNFFDLATTLVKRRKHIIYPVLGVMLITVTCLLLTPNRYTSTVSMLPSGKQDKLSDLKSLAGMGSLIKVDENSSELFPEILRSRAVKDAVLSRTYNFKDDDETKSVDLKQYFGHDDRDLLYRDLDRVTEFSIDKRTGVIRLAVETEYPGLSQAVLSSYVTELENFNLHKRRSQGKENEIYLAKQLTQKKRELSDAEKELERFQLENRNWNATSNAEILGELTRLQREVEIKSTAYLYLNQEYEMARFEAQKDVPIVSLLDTPSLPTQKSGPFRAMILALVTLMTLFVSVFTAIIAESLSRKSRRPENVDFENLRRDIKVAFPRVTQTLNRIKLTEKETV